MDTSPYKIFIVEDDEFYRRLLEYNLSLNPDYIVSGFATGKACLDRLQERPDLITLDYRLPDGTADKLLRKIKAADETIQVIMISEQEDIEVAVNLLKEGAEDYLVKSTDIQQRLLNTVERCRKTRSLTRQIAVLKKEVQQKYDFQKSIIGDSEVMQQVLDLVAKAAETNINVMISGETGTGKEVIAKAIHYNSRRKHKSLVAVNMSAIPQDLIESELFGHEKGAFTGAATRRIGKFEEADGGTLFLDEIGEMDITLQAKLLRALEEREVTRIGSNKPVKFDCRIITATHRNLREAIRENRFREDLYYRLFGLPIELPPLRSRGKDILILATKFVERFCKDNEMEPPILSPGAQQKLLAYHFPGNVRELKSLVELAIITCTGSQIKPECIRLSDEEVLPQILSESLTLREYNLRILDTYMEKYNKDIRLVATKLDISVATIYRMLKERVSS